MQWRSHSNLSGSHAFLSASKYHWIGYSDAKLIETYRSFTATQRGTQLHEFAASCIKLNQKLPKSHKTLNLYVNDAVGFKMNPEQVLYYSPNCYGTADAICFRNNELRIHDLKTGSSPVHMEQLIIYAALFCLEYEMRPEDIRIELRIYQNNEVLCHEPQSDEIADIMAKIKRFDAIINDIVKQEG